MSWPAARSAPMSEYLLADAHPAISTPSTDSDDTARAKKIPTSRFWAMRCGPAGTTTKSRKVDMITTAGARAKTQRSARAGKMSSFCTNFTKSPMSWNQP